MFYLDYLLYIIILIQLWILLSIYSKNMQEGFQDKKKKKKDNGNKKGESNSVFQHKGNAFMAPTVAKPSIIDSIKVINIFEGIYKLLNIFAVIFVQYPNQYIAKIRNLLQEQLLIMFDFYKSLMQKSNEIFQTYMKKFNILGSIKVVFTKPNLHF